MHRTSSRILAGILVVVAVVAYQVTLSVKARSSMGSWDVTVSQPGLESEHASLILKRGPSPDVSGTYKISLVEFPFNVKGKSVNDQITFDVYTPKGNIAFNGTMDTQGNIVGSYQKEWASKDTFKFTARHKSRVQAWVEPLRG